MVGIIEASAAYNTIKTAFGLAQGIASLKTETEINSAVIAIQRTLLQAQEEAFSDKETISTLATRIREMEAEAAQAGRWEAEKSRYTLTASTLGAFTYDLKPEFHNQETPHRLCATCFSDGIKSILHTKANHNGGELVHCGRCKSDLVLAKFKAVIASTGRRRVSMWDSR